MAEMMNIGGTDKVNATKSKMFWQYTILKKKISSKEKLFKGTDWQRSPYFHTNVLHITLLILFYTYIQHISKCFHDENKSHSLVAID